MLKLKIKTVISSFISAGYYKCISNALANNNSTSDKSDPTNNKGISTNMPSPTITLSDEHALANNYCLR